MNPSLSEVELSPSLVVLTLGGDSLQTAFGANCVACAGRDATLVVDPLVAPSQGRLVDDALRRRGFPPVRWVVATHHHTDHVLGAPPLLRQGATLVAHRTAAERMSVEHPALIAERRRLPALRVLFADSVVCLPSVTVERPHRIDLGGRTIEVRPLGHAHSPGDCAVLVEDAGTVCCGDVVLAGYHFNFEDADAARVPGALRSLGALAEQGYSRFIPGHGPIGGPNLIEENLRYHDEVARIVAASPTPAAAGDAIRARWPAWRLDAAIASALTRRWP